MNGKAQSEADRLDNPIWHALAGPHRHLGAAYGPVRRYLPEYAPFAAFEDPSTAPMSALLDAIPSGAAAVMFTDKALAPLPGIEIVMAGVLPQMVARRPMQVQDAANVVPLGVPDVPEMLDLVELTQPGPFARRTVEMGRISAFVSMASLPLWPGSGCGSMASPRSAPSAPIHRIGGKAMPRCWCRP